MQKCAFAGNSVRRQTVLTVLILGALLGALAPRPVLAATPRPAHGASLARPSRQFWVARSTGWQHLWLEQVAEGAHVRLYAAKAWSLSAGEADDLVSTFEARILPTDVRLFGSVPGLTPVDIALVPLDNTTLGYFDQNDVDPVATGGDQAHSNHANVLFARLPSAMPDRNKLADTEEVIAHELQHLIEYRARIVQRHLRPQDDWLNEGLSFYAQIANGFWTPRDALKLGAACGDPFWPVTSLNRSLSFLRHDARIAYGRAGLFMTYLVGRFGPRMARNLVLSPYAGMAAVDNRVHSIDPGLSAPSVYADWGVAQYLRQPGIYGYGPYARNLRSAPRLALPAVTAYPFDSQAAGAAPFTLRPWGQAFYQFVTRGGQNTQIRVDAPPGTARIAAVMEDTSHVSHPLVRWLSFRRDGSALLKLNSLADLYNRVTLVVSAFPGLNGTGAVSRIRLRAALINVSDNDRPTGSAAPAGGNPDLTLGKVLQLDQPVSVLAVNPEATRISAGDA